jgi:hypothetical protein
MELLAPIVNQQVRSGQVGGAKQKQSDRWRGSIYACMAMQLGGKHHPILSLLGQNVVRSRATMRHPLPYLSKFVHVMSPIMLIAERGGLARGRIYPGSARARRGWRVHCSRLALVSVSAMDEAGRASPSPRGAWRWRCHPRPGGGLVRGAQRGECRRA